MNGIAVWALGADPSSRIPLLMFVATHDVRACEVVDAFAMPVILLLQV